MDIRFGVGDAKGPLEPRLDVQARSLLEGEDVVMDASTVLAIQGDRVVGVLCVQMDETCPASYLGELPAQEAYVSKFVWNSTDWGGASHLIVGAASRIQARFGLRLQWRFSQKDHRWDAMREVANAAGLQLFQEKRCYSWDERMPACEDSISLVYRNIEEFGIGNYCELLTASGEGTLDRNDAWYREKAGARNWGKAFMGYYDPAHAKTWLVAFNRSDQPLGFIAISSLAEPETATITYVGVLPEHRGAGVIDDLLRSGVRAARCFGYTKMRSDADVENHPMGAAFERNGHLASCMPRVGWHYRA